MNGKYDKGAKQRELSSSLLKSKHWTSETTTSFMNCFVLYAIMYKYSLNKTNNSDLKETVV